MKNIITRISPERKQELRELIDLIQQESYKQGYEDGKVVATQEAVKRVGLARKSANQQRAELIEKAKKFVEQQIDPNHGGYVITGNKCVTHLCDAKFKHNYKKYTTTCILVGISTGYTRKKAVAFCNPKDVFNEPLGEVISLCKALEIDIPVEFLEAVQPIEKVVGMVVMDDEHIGGKHTLIASGESLKKGYAHIGSPVGQDGIIIDDTNAQYEITS